MLRVFSPTLEKYYDMIKLIEIIVHLHIFDIVKYFHSKLFSIENWREIFVIVIWLEHSTLVFDAMDQKCSIK